MIRCGEPQGAAEVNNHRQEIIYNTPINSGCSCNPVLQSTITNIQLQPVFQITMAICLKKDYSVWNQQETCFIPLVQRVELVRVEGMVWNFLFSQNLTSVAKAAMNVIGKNEHKSLRGIYECSLFTGARKIVADSIPCPSL